MYKRQSDNCIVNGDLELIDEGKLRFEQLYDQENKVTVGERIVTSNISEKFVEGLFIGYVSEVQVDSNNLTKTGTIVTPVDFLHLKDVFVITVNKQDLVDGTAQVEGNSDSGSSADGTSVWSECHGDGGAIFLYCSVSVFADQKPGLWTADISIWLAGF